MRFLDKISDLFGIEEQEKKESSRMQVKNFNGIDIAVGHKTGRRHAAFFEDCEDNSGYRMFGSKATIAVSDGCSSAKEAELAAKVSVDFALQYMQEKDWSNMTKESITDDFINGLQKCLSESEKDYEELSATLIAASFDKNTNAYLLLSIGDGLVFAYDKNFNSELIVSPFNRAGDVCRTCFGNDFDVREHIQIFKGNLLNENEEYLGFAICSDGAEVLNRDRNYGNEVLRSAALAVKNEHKAFLENMISEIQTEKTQDDVAIGILLTTPNREANLANIEKTLESELNVEKLVCKMAEAQIPIQYGGLILTKLHQEEGMSFDELVEQGICPKGAVLRIMIPLIKCNLVEYKEQKFKYRNEEFA